MDLIRRYPFEAYQQALQAWAWLPDLAGKGPAFTSAFGDVFLQDRDGSYWLLDTVEGTLTRRWPTTDALEAELMSPEGQDTYLMAELLGAADRAGLEPGAGDVLAFKVAPVLGGSLEVENLQVVDFVVNLDILGQIHQQLRELPPGTRITGFSIEDP